MATLLVIRHCAPVGTGAFLGLLDVSLSPAGEDYASSAFPDVEAAVVYSSPLRRALDTAKHIRGSEHQVLPELREIDYGVWTGKTWAEVEEGWGELARTKLEDWRGVTPPGGESWAAVLRRAGAALEIIRSGPQPAAVVAHLGINAVLMHLISGCDPLTFRQEYGEVVRVEYD